MSVGNIFNGVISKACWTVALTLIFATAQMQAADDGPKKEEKHEARPAPPQPQRQAAPQRQEHARPAERPHDAAAPASRPNPRANDAPVNRQPHNADRPAERPADRPVRTMDRPVDRPANPQVNHAGSPPSNNRPMNDRQNDRQMNERRDASPQRVATPPPARNDRFERTPPMQGSNRQGFSRGADGHVQTYRSPAGHEVHYAPNGQVRQVQMGGRTIVHTGGGSRIIYERTDRTIIVTNRSGHGYVQRPFAYRGQEYVHRTYYRQGVAYSRYYRPYSYHGVMFYNYAPVRYYPAPFYSWAYEPWGRPVYYRWGWSGSPWYGYYGGYFAPSPYYASPALWMVDYIIAERLAESYNERAAQQAYASQGSAPLSPEVKQQIAMEVQRQMDMERAQSQQGANDPSAGGLPQMMSDGQPHVFVVSYTIDVTDQRGQECSVTRGDVLRLTQPPAPDAQAAYVTVVASKGQDCRAGSVITVSLQDLQDTNNQMREAVNAGMGELQTRAGQGGLPVLPSSARGPAAPAPFAETAPPADPQVAQELQQEVQEADRMEQQVVNEARSADQGQAPGMNPMPPQQQGPQGQAPAPVRIEKGQTVNEVVSVLGNPSQIVEVGKKLVYVYPNLKITFNSGRVSDVQ